MNTIITADVVDLITLNSTIKQSVNNLNERLAENTDISKWCEIITSTNNELENVFSFGAVNNAELDRKTNEKLKKYKKLLADCCEFNQWYSSVININNDLENILNTAPDIEYFGLGEDSVKYNFKNEEAIFGSLNLSGYDRSEVTLSFIKNNLEFIKVRTKKTDYAWIEKNELKTFGDKKTANLFYSWADSEELIDYCSELPGWLSKKGEALLKKLTQLGY